MPHLILDITTNIAERAQVHGILEQLVTEFCEYETIASASVKGYVTVRDIYKTGDGAAPGFIHLQVCVLAGRDPALLNQMADGLYSMMAALFARSVDQNLAGLTLEIREMAPQTYRK